MKNKFFKSIAILGLTTLILTSCSKVPQVEIDATNAAIEQAKTAGAEVYVPENFIALQDSMNSVMVNIESQKSKLFKNYTVAKQQLVTVTQLANEVSQLAETRKEELKLELQTLITEVKALIDANRQLVLEAPKGKEGTSALVAINSEIDVIEASVLEANTMLENGDYLTAIVKAKAAKEKATSINAELTEVIAKYKANVKGKKK